MNQNDWRKRKYTLSGQDLEYFAYRFIGFGIGETKRKDKLPDDETQEVRIGQIKRYIDETFDIARIE